MEIRYHRKQAKLTQAKLASLVGISQPYLCEVERQKKTNPSLNLLKRMAKVLNVSVSDLLGDKAS